MPTYQYACTACGHQLEAVQSFADEPLTECPACEGRLRKVFNSVGIVFKGSGFYRTDSRGKTSESSSSSSSSTDSSSSSSTSSSSSSSSGSESKPAAAKSESSSSSSAKPTAAASSSSAA